MPAMRKPERTTANKSVLTLEFDEIGGWGKVVPAQHFLIANGRFNPLTGHSLYQFIR